MGIVEQQLLQLKNEKRRLRRAAAILAVLSLLVATGVSWKLHMTGITIANGATCGREEHQHTEECATEKVLICGYDEEIAAEVSVEASTEAPAEKSVEETSTETQAEEAALEEVQAEIGELRTKLNQYEDPLERFNENLFKETVKSVTIDKNRRITFTLLGDLTFTETL